MTITLLQLDKSGGFQKPSFIDECGKSIRNRNKEKTKSFNIVELNLGELIKIITK